MLVYLLKQLASARHAVLGRKEPAQLAWGVAFGVLLGIVPHGNLLAVGLLVLLLSLRVNHGVAAVAAVATTLLAIRLDPYSHRVGLFVLTHEDFSRHIANAWQLPLVPWTDVNNTVVTGSLIIGLVALVPLFLLTYPIFHWIAPKGTPVDGDSGGAIPAAAPKRSAKSASPKSMRPRQIVADIPPLSISAATLEPHAIDAAMNGMMAAKPSPHPMPAESQVMETRIDVIRMAPGKGAAAVPEVEAKDVSEQDEPMSEALNYLLRQLNDSRQRRAA